MCRQVHAFPATGYVGTYNTRRNDPSEPKLKPALPFSILVYYSPSCQHTMPVSRTNFREGDRVRGAK